MFLFLMNYFESIFPAFSRIIYYITLIMVNFNTSVSLHIQFHRLIYQSMSTAQCEFSIILIEKMYINKLLSIVS